MLVERSFKMNMFLIVLQVLVALGLLNVWLIRREKGTEYRGGNAHSMREEFAVYGLPAWSMYLVGGLKILAAICLIAGIWMHALILPASVVLIVLMIGALAMHLRVSDPAKKSLPAVMLLIASGLIGWGAIR